MPTQEWRDNNQEKIKAYRRTWYQKNKQSVIDRSKKDNAIHRQKNTQLINEKKNVGCFFCHEKDICCLDFHHLDPKSKDFDVASGKHLSTTKLIEEMAKCIVICANCHRKLHAGKLAPPTGFEPV